MRQWITLETNNRLTKSFNGKTEDEMSIDILKSIDILLGLQKTTSVHRPECMLRKDLRGAYPLPLAALEALGKKKGKAKAELITPCPQR